MLCQSNCSSSVIAHVFGSQSPPLSLSLGFLIVCPFKMPLIVEVQCWRLCVWIGVLEVVCCGWQVPGVVCCKWPTSHHEVECWRFVCGKCQVTSYHVDATTITPDHRQWQRFLHCGWMCIETNKSQLTDHVQLLIKV